jgi:hypothetical protein
VSKARYRSNKEAERIRTEACRCAATVLAGRSETALAPTCWSPSVFFETYIANGSKATRKDFGPKKPVKLKIAKGDA